MTAVTSAPGTDLDALLATQHGLVHRTQLADVGVTRAVRRERLARGAWSELLPGTYLTTDRPPSSDQRLLAARLYAGDGAQLTGIEALVIHGFHHLPDDPFVRILVPHTRQIGPAAFVRVNRTRRPDARPSTYEGVPVVSASRALADTARHHWAGTHDDIQLLIQQAIDRDLVTAAELHRELDRGPRQHSSLLRRSLADLGTFAGRPID